MITLKLTGILYSKENGRRIVINPKTKKPMVIKSAKAIACSNSFILQAKSQYKGQPLEGEIAMKATIYYPDRRFDLVDSLLCDILQKAGVVENDRMIYHKELHKDFDKKNPRVEVELEVVKK